MPALIGSLAALLACQLAGEVVARLAGLPVPGPVIGMGLLLVVLLARERTPGALEDTARVLLACLALLFVPAGVGIITHAERVQEEWLALAVTLVASTAITMVVTAVTLRGMMRRRGD